MGDPGESVTGGVPVTADDVCRWADAFDTYYAAIADDPVGNIDAEGVDETWLSRWEAHRSVADICRLARSMASALRALEQWDMLHLAPDGRGGATADAPWARALIREALAGHSGSYGEVPQ